MDVVDFYMLYIVSDHAGFHLKQSLLSLLEQESIEYEDIGLVYTEGDDYPDAAKLLASKIQSTAHFGLAICGSGQGICMALNRFSGIRAGVSTDEETVKLIRQHNWANILCLPGRGFDEKSALQLIKTFLTTPPDLSERHKRRVNMLDNLG
jgi:ribose 5-phosphate isomerase B